MKKISVEIARREFLKAGVFTAAIGTVGLRVAIRTALAQARSSKKPLLTERNFNKLIPEDALAFRRLAIEAKQDLRAFIKRYFHLTEGQRRKLEALTSQEIDLVKSEIDKALKGSYRIRVQFRRRSNTTVGMRYVPAQQTIDPNAPTICGSGTNSNCKGNICACGTMTGNDFGGVIGYGDDCDIAGG